MDHLSSPHFYFILFYFSLENVTGSETNFRSFPRFSSSEIQKKNNNNKKKRNPPGYTRATRVWPSRAVLKGKWHSVTKVASSSLFFPSILPISFFLFVGLYPPCLFLSPAPRGVEQSNENETFLLLLLLDALVYINGRQVVEYSHHGNRRKVSSISNSISSRLFLLFLSDIVCHISFFRLIIDVFFFLLFF
jgi:hypothetical protein